MPVEYVHRPLDREVQAAGGHYVVTEEVLLPFHGDEVLYQKGYALIDTSCCGVSGCPFVHVKGIVVSWKTKSSRRGEDISFVEPIRDEGHRRQLRALLGEKEAFHQIRFD